MRNWTNLGLLFGLKNLALKPLIFSLPLNSSERVLGDQTFYEWPLYKPVIQK